MDWKKGLVGLGLLGFMVIMMGCRETSDRVIEGRVIASNAIGTVPIEVRLYKDYTHLDEEQPISETIADPDGKFKLEIPSGMEVVNVVVCRPNYSFYNFDYIAEYSDSARIEINLQEQRISSRADSVWIIGDFCEFDKSKKKALIRNDSGLFTIDIPWSDSVMSYQIKFQYSADWMVNEPENGFRRSSGFKGMPDYVSLIRPHNGVCHIRVDPRRFTACPGEWKRFSSSALISGLPRNALYDHLMKKINPKYLQTLERNYWLAFDQKSGLFDSPITDDELKRRQQQVRTEMEQSHELTDRVIAFSKDSLLVNLALAGKIMLYQIEDQPFDKQWALFRRMTYIPHPMEPLITKMLEQLVKQDSAASAQISLQPVSSDIEQGLVSVDTSGHYIKLITAKSEAGSTSVYYPFQKRSLEFVQTILRQGHSLWNTREALSSLSDLLSLPSEYYFNLFIETQSLHYGILSSHQAPDFKYLNKQKQWIHLSDYRGQWILLFFSSTSCAFCDLEYPYLEASQREFPELKIIQIIETSTQPAGADAYESDYKKRLAIIDAAEPQITIHQQWGIWGVPRLFLIDPDGRVITEPDGTEIYFRGKQMITDLRRFITTRSGSISVRNVK